MASDRENAATKPRVSVVIPAYNAEATLRQTIDSALRQTFQDIEVIVVDDGSTDGTLAIANSYEDRVRPIAQSNQGVSVARNNGIAAARGELIALLDADDEWHPQKLEKQVAVLDTMSDVMGTYVGVVRVSASGEVIEHLPARRFENLCRSLLLYSSVIPNSPSNLVLRREVFTLVGGFDANFSYCADWDFLIRLSLRIRLEPIDDWLSRYRSAPGNMSSNIALLERDTFSVLEKFYSTEHAETYADIKDWAYSNHWMILSGSYLHARQLGNSIRCLARAAQHDPRNLTYAMGSPVRALRRWNRRRRSRRQPAA